MAEPARILTLAFHPGPPIGHTQHPLGNLTRVEFALELLWHG
jgi:hypothetical protein